MFRGEDGNKVALPRHTMWLMRHVARLRPGQSSVQASCLGTSVGQLPSMACGFPHPTTAAFLAASGDQGSLAATEGKKKPGAPTGRQQLFTRCPHSPVLPAPGRGLISFLS